MTEFSKGDAKIQAEVHCPTLVTLHTSFDFAAHPGIALVIGATRGVEGVVGPFRYNIMLMIGKVFSCEQVVEDVAAAAFRFIDA